MSAKKKILCRADGDANMGLGHLYRVLAIAEFYKDYYQIIIVTKETSTFSIIPKEFSKITIPSQINIFQESEWLAHNFTPNEHIIIADGYQFDSLYQKSIKESGYMLLYIDDLAVEHMFADVIINHSPHCSKTDFKSEEYTQFALGTSYAMLRPCFNEMARKKRKIDKIESAFVSFGGSDKFDLTLIAVKALIEIKSIKAIHVVLGAAYKHQKLISLAQEDNSIIIHKNLGELELCNVMLECQLAIVPASTILYEICSVKMYALSGYYVDNQKYIYEEFEKKGLIAKGGDMANYTTDDFKRNISSILEESNKEHYLLKQQNFFDGKSKLRFLSLLNNFNISFRKANIDDLMLVFDWSNDAYVRQNSYHSVKINLDDHKNWFGNKISDKNVLFLIAMINNEPAGIVRYEVNNEHAIVGILVSRKFRGQGLSTSFLKKSAKHYSRKFSLPVLAYIKVENKASIRAFEKAGYHYYSNENINGSSSFVYKLEKDEIRG